MYEGNSCVSVHLLLIIASDLTEIDFTSRGVTRLPRCVSRSAASTCLEMPNVEIHQQILRLNFLDRMCLQGEGNSLLLKEDAKKALAAFRNMHDGEQEGGRTPRPECSFYREC